MTSISLLLFTIWALLFSVCIEDAKAQQDLRPVLNTMARRLVDKCQEFGCPCYLEAERATGRPSDNQQVDIEGELKASAAFLEAHANISVRYSKNECRLLITKSDVRGNLKGISRCRIAAEFFGGIDFLRKELRINKEININPTDCSFINDSVVKILGENK